jgi:trans-aconitate methyltransferase
VENARKNLSQGKKNLSEVKKNLNQSTVYILPKHPHIKKHTLNKIKHAITIAFQMPGNKPYNTGIRLEEVKVKVKFTLEQSMKSQR